MAISKNSTLVLSSLGMIPSPSWCSGVATVSVVDDLSAKCNENGMRGRLVAPPMVTLYLSLYLFWSWFSFSV